VEIPGSGVRIIHVLDYFLQLLRVKSRADLGGVVVIEASSYSRLIDFHITQLKAQGPSRFCNESKEEKKDRGGPSARRRTGAS
jgi:hypothetical protein